MIKAYKDISHPGIYDIYVTIKPNFIVLTKLKFGLILKATLL